MFAADFHLRRTAECHQERLPPQTGERGCGELIVVREQRGVSQQHIRSVLISRGLQAMCVFIVIVNNKKQLQINGKSCISRARRKTRPVITADSRRRSADAVCRSVRRFAVALGVPSLRRRLAAQRRPSNTYAASGVPFGTYRDHNRSKQYFGSRLVLSIVGC